jgi:hypothetical protein
MKIPKKFKLHGFDIDVEFSDTLRNKTDRDGESRYRENKIILHSNKDGVYTNQMREQVFLHELVHHILYHMYEDDQKDEKFVECFSFLLHQALETMEY